VAPPPERRTIALVLRALVIAALLGLVTLRTAPVVLSQPSGVKVCVGPTGGKTARVGDTVNCTLTINAVAGDMPSGTSISLAESSTNFDFTNISASGTCLTNPSNSICTPIVSGNTVRVDCDQPLVCSITQIAISETLLVTASTPSNIIQSVSVLPPLNTTPFTFTVTGDVTIVSGAAGTTYFVGPTTPPASDMNPCQTADEPCATIPGALARARDGDTILLLAGTHIITKTVVVTKLVAIQPDSGAKVVLRSRGIGVIFEIRAQGGPGLHAVVRNFTLGGDTKAEKVDAFHLINDNFTELAGNIIGAEDLPLTNGIVLSNSDHGNIHDNVIQGHTGFTFTPLLTVGKNGTGFGITSIECFGQPGPGVSDSVTITNNIFTNLWLSGIWLCSDGGGEHQITGNILRGNFRGISLKDITNSTISDNVLTDDRSDGIVLYGASLRNRIVNNRIESHVSPDAAGIRIGWIADPFVPLDNRLENNRLARDTVGVHIFGARSTQLKSNEIKISGARTAVLITPSTFPLDPSTQPRDTEITGNVLVFAGPCSQALGCAIRMVGTTVPVLATDNDWGFRSPGDVEGAIWHRTDDPVLGFATFSPFRGEVTPTPRPTVSGSATPTGNGTPGPTSTPSSNGTPTPTPGSNGGGFTSVTLNQGCQTIMWPGAGGLSVLDAVQGISPVAAQRTTMIWQRQSNGEWRGWGPGLDRRAPGDIFNLQRGDTLQVCIGQRAEWSIPTTIGG
jgi:parallel beta-helix repeat protein